MVYVYNGLFSTVFNWVLNKILSPVFNFMAGLLSKVLSWLFNTILEPLLELVLGSWIKVVADMLLEALAGIIYGIFSRLLSLVDTISHVFDYLIGLSDVSYNAGNGPESMTLARAMFSIPSVRNAYLAISFIGLILAMVLAAYAVAKSAMDLDFENRRPVSRVLSALFRAFIHLATLQIFVTFMFYLAEAILKAINTAVNYTDSGDSTTLGRIIFCISSLNAAKDPANNIGLATKSGTISVETGIRKPYYFLSGKGITPVSYTNVEQVKQTFKLAKFDYLIGFVLALALLIILAACLLVFVQRLFDMLILYIASPFFVAMIPLDDGEKFGKWREMFIGKCFSGFGMVIAMKLYIMLCPIIMNTQQLMFSEGSPEMDYLTRTVFLLGGAYAVYKSGNMVTSLISQAAGSSEAGAAMAGGGLAMGAGAMLGRAGMALGGAGIRKLSERNKNGGKNAGTGEGGKDLAAAGGTGGQAFTAKGGSAKFGAVPGLAAAGKNKAAAGKPAGVSAAGAGTGKAAAGSAGKAAAAGTAKTAASGAAGKGAAGSAAGKGPADGAQPKKVLFHESLGKSIAFGIGEKFGLKRSFDNQGKPHYAWKPGNGKLFNIGKDAKGRTNIRFFGMGARLGADGEVNKVNVPFASFNVGKNGKPHFNQVKLAGFNIKTNKKGGVYFKDCSILGMHQELDQNRNAHVTNFGMLGLKREADANGNYRMTGLFGKEVKQEMGADGQYHVTSMFGGQVKRELGADGDYHVTKMFDIERIQDNGEYRTTGLGEFHEHNYAIPVGEQAPEETPWYDIPKAEPETPPVMRDHLTKSLAGTVKPTKSSQETDAWFQEQSNKYRDIPEPPVTPPPSPASSSSSSAASSPPPAASGTAQAVPEQRPFRGFNTSVFEDTEEVTEDMKWARTEQKPEEKKTTRSGRKTTHRNKKDDH